MKKSVLLLCFFTVLTALSGCSDISESFAISDNSEIQADTDSQETEQTFGDVPPAPETAVAAETSDDTENEYVSDNPECGVPN